MTRLGFISLLLVSLVACASPTKHGSRPPVVEVTNETDGSYVVTAVVAAGDARGQDVDAQSVTTIILPGKAEVFPVDRERLMRVQFLVQEWDDSLDARSADGDVDDDPVRTPAVLVRYAGRERLTCTAVVVAGNETSTANDAWIHTFDLDPSDRFDVPFGNERLEQVKLVIHEE